MSNYKKGKDGYYRASIVVGRLENGNQQRKTVKARSKKEFEQKLSDLKYKYDRGIDFDASKATVEEWAMYWVRLYKDPTVGASTRSNIRSLLNKHIFPRIGHLPVCNVKPFHLQEIMNLQSGKSKSNTLKIVGVLKQLFDRAKQNGLILDNPAEYLELPQTSVNHRRALTSEEREAVLNVCQTHRAGLWVMFMLMCGLRRGETIPLTWGDIDFKSGMLTVNKSAEFISNVANTKLPKTSSGIRTIPIPPPLLARLTTERKSDNELIFTPAKSDGMLTETNCKRLWNSFYRALDIEMGAELYRNEIKKSSLKDGISPHALRHTYATDLYLMGVDLKTAQYLLGHADIKTTANIYTHMRGDMLTAVQIKQAEFYSQERSRKIEIV